MAVIVVGLVTLGVIVVVALIVWYTHLTSQDRLIRDQLLIRYLVTLKSGETFDGLLRDVDGRSLVLVQAKALQPGVEPAAIDGTLLLFRSDIAYLQRP